MTDHPEMHGPMMGDWMWGGMLIWTFVGIALLVLIVVAAIWLGLRLRPGDGERRRPDSTALAELRRRYARGELDRETFLAVRRDLLGPD